jgi:hypothetical protein
MLATKVVSFPRPLAYKVYASTHRVKKDKESCATPVNMLNCISRLQPSMTNKRTRTSLGPAAFQLSMASYARVAREGLVEETQVTRRLL